MIITSQTLSAAVAGITAATSSSPRGLPVVGNTLQVKTRAGEMLTVKLADNFESAVGEIVEAVGSAECPQVGHHVLGEGAVRDERVRSR